MTDLAALKAALPCKVEVKVTPKTSQSAITGITTDDAGRFHLTAKLRAAPEGGKANAELEALLAKGLGLPKSSVSVVRGETARNKLVSLGL